MRQMKLVLLGTFLVITVAGFCGTMTGCGDTAGTSDVTVTPEAKKADLNLQEGMKDFMKSKGQTKAPAKK
jgi:hypothetical protein